MERHFAGVGTILGMLPASGTILGRIGDYVQEVRQLKSVAKFGLAGREVVAADEAADGVQEIFNSAKEIGWGAGDLKRFAKSASDVSRHGPMSAGRMHVIPLGNVTLADTFRSSSYFSYKNTEPLTLYRVQGKPFENGDRLGRFWTRDKPSGPVQSMIDSALDPTWGNTGTHWVKIEVPPGTSLFEGVADSQRGLVGGGNQIVVEHIPNTWLKEQGKF